MLSRQGWPLPQKRRFVAIPLFCIQIIESTITITLTITITIAITMTITIAILNK
jgi:hypothetical protein